ncbi:hypothetical protein FQA39_LY01893 [Lamprigera yunnana]|nr:hypothetical protein FQA39_LY01893 [Lamprigera yunnana]
MKKCSFWGNEKKTSFASRIRRGASKLLFANEEELSLSGAENVTTFFDIETGINPAQRRIFQCPNKATLVIGTNIPLLRDVGVRIGKAPVGETIGYATRELARSASIGRDSNLGHLPLGHLNFALPRVKRTEFSKFEKERYEGTYGVIAFEIVNKNLKNVRIIKAARTVQLSLRYLIKIGEMLQFCKMLFVEAVDYVLKKNTPIRSRYSLSIVRKRWKK